ncbi:MAG: Rab family GTPase, partial [Candidatus Hermodarchaeota archaeon]
TVLKKIIIKFNELFPKPINVSETSTTKESFISFLYEAQKTLHSKITIIGPIESGKTTLYNLLKTSEEKGIMDFAKSSIFQIDELNFDIWDFQLHDNFSLMWSKFIGGSDLTILLIDSKNYNSKIIEHFLSLKQQHARHSKLILIANKSDLASKEEIDRIKSLINRPNVQELSLLNSKAAREKVFSLVKNVLNLKSELPEDFYNLINEAESARLENKIDVAISKYEDLITLSNEYQNFSYIESFKKKLKELNDQKEKQLELDRRRNEQKYFGAPEQIKFTKKISVKSLPKTDAKTTTNTPKTTLKTYPKPIPKTVPKTKPKTIDSSEKSKKLFLKPQDIKISLKSKIEKIHEIQKKGVETIKSIPSRILEKAAEFTAPKELSNEEQLQSLIISKGSTLNIKLCKKFVEEMENILDSLLTRQDLEFAAESFFKLENFG